MIRRFSCQYDDLFSIIISYVSLLLAVSNAVIFMFMSSSVEIIKLLILL